MTQCRYCDQTAIARYGTGYGCADHTAAKLAGRPEPPTPDPERTLEALRSAAGRVWGFNRDDTSLNDRRAIESGRRVSGAKRRAANE